MTIERIEAELRGEIPADEAAYRPRQLPATIAQARVDVDTRRERPRLLMALAATVAVVAAGAIGVAAWTAMNADAGGQGIGSGASRSAEPSATPGEPGACTATDFAVASDPWDAGAGSRGTTVIFRVVASTASCTLPTQIVARIVDATGAMIVGGSSDPAAPAVVVAGTQLEMGVAWSNFCGSAPPDGMRLEVELAEGAAWIPVVPPGGTSVLVPPCMGVGQASNLSVTTFQASERPPIEG